QAEDGIRDDLVTGVQTCALPISGEDRADDLGVLLAVAAEQVTDGRARHPEVLGTHGEGAHDALADLRDAALAGVGDLVEAGGAEIGRASCRQRWWRSERAVRCHK